ncbi:MAG: hypothetical protein MUP69_05045 [Candidatus Atribacteria bacterium]|nr:hypothetical protein [Candidatus Atribacteria bacterium]
MKPKNPYENVEVSYGKVNEAVLEIVKRVWQESLDTAIKWLNEPCLNPKHDKWLKEGREYAKKHPAKRIDCRECCKEMGLA